MVYLCAPFSTTYDYSYMEPLAQLLDILKYTLPALIVFGVAYYMMQQHSEQQQRIWMRQTKDESRKIVLPIRLQAYERLMLLCDRVSIPNTLLRVRMPNTTVSDLRMTLLIAISQEFDHNTAQQLYVSETLWKIITFAKNDTLNTINRVTENLDPKADAQLLANALLDYVGQPEYADSLQKAQIALRQEAGQLF